MGPRVRRVIQALSTKRLASGNLVNEGVSCSVRRGKSITSIALGASSLGSDIVCSLAVTQGDKPNF